MIAIGGSKAHATDQQQAKIEFSENTDTLALTRLQMLKQTCGIEHPRPLGQGTGRIEPGRINLSNRVEDTCSRLRWLVSISGNSVDSFVGDGG